MNRSRGRRVSLVGTPFRVRRLLALQWKLQAHNSVEWRSSEFHLLRPAEMHKGSLKPVEYRLEVDIIMISFRVGLCDLPDFFWHFWSLFLQIRICTGVLYPDSLVKPAMKNQGVEWPWVWGTIECGRALASTLLLQLLWWRDQPQECGICQESLIHQVPSSIW